MTGEGTNKKEDTTKSTGIRMRAVRVRVCSI